MQRADYEWFLQNYPSLYEKYGVSYLAIKNEEVLGVYTSCADAVNETSKTEEIGSFIVQFCNGNESAYTNYIASMFVLAD